MDFTMGDDVDALRRTLRDLIDAHIPVGWLGAFSDDPTDLAVAQAFCKLLAEHELLCPAWPSAYGGRDASLWEQTAMREEMWAHHEPRGPQYMGVNWVGPILQRHGSSEQKTRHLPRIARGEVIWCQGFSEPDAGSDLSSLRTAATHDGERWHLSGQKIWTSYATMAQWCFLLARSATGERKHHGLTIFLVPMDSPGITVRPIATMLGPHHLNEVFFDDVVVGDDAVLGGVGDGWSIVREVLAFERVGIARYARVERLLMAVPHVLGSTWETADPALQQSWARALVRTRRARLLAYRVVAAQHAGDVDPTDAAAYRIAVTTLDQESADVLASIIDASRPRGERGERFIAAVEDHWKYSRAATVSSGSTEMQRILLARALIAPSGGASDDRLVATVTTGPMNIELSFEATEYAKVARSALGRLGVNAPDDAIAAVLDELGAGDLDPHNDSDDLEAAAMLCRAVGWAASGYPVDDRFVRQAVGVAAGKVAGIDRSVVATDADGDQSAGALSIVLGCWVLLGHLDRAMELTIAHVCAREQFGEPLASFQGVQFALSDAEVERAGADQVGHYALWSVQQGRPEALDDALAGRLAVLEASRVVFGVAHQLHGAIGFCDETPLSWVTRTARPRTRVPWDLWATRRVLTERIKLNGLVGLFDGDRVR